MTWITLFLITLFIALSSCNKSNKTDYKNSKLSIDKRVADLLSKMTLEEKVAQTICGNNLNQKMMDSSNNFNPDKVKEIIRNGLGGIVVPDLEPKETVRYLNALQKHFVESTRLGIPVLTHVEGLHGFLAKKATSFPQAIALASTWDTTLIEQVFTVVASEIRARGGHQALTPVIDIARDPRWGRIEETYGEDPYLVSRIGVSCIKGLQGKNSDIDSMHVISTLKHFAVHGQPESGVNTANGNFSERVIRDFFLYPFNIAIKEANPRAVMASYNEIDGVPSHKNKWLLEKILRQEWGFQGMVVSDYYGVRCLHLTNFVAADTADATKQAIEAGVDMELPDIEYYYHSLVDLVKKGKVSESTIDKAVARVLKAKFQLGLFEQPYVDEVYTEKITNCKEHQKLALKAAEEAIVLLKNENQILPLDIKKLKSIAVIGPNADYCHLGGYSGDPGRRISILQGIIDKLGNQVKVNYAKGCNITKTEGKIYTDKIELNDPIIDLKNISKAVQVAKASDITLLVVGGNEETTREAWASFHLGDRTTLDLMGRQNDLVEAVVKTGKPVIVLLINGGPLSINYIAQNANAILEGWYLGQETGTAIANTLFGDNCPGGKLPVTFPRSVGQVPCYYNYKPEAKRGYVLDDISPLYAFGYGLSYTTFNYSGLKLAKNQIKQNERTIVSVEITNTGKIKGDEIVQLYIRDKVSSVTRPVKELRGFVRISLDPKQTKTVNFDITPDKLAFTNIDMKYGVEAGDFEIMVGSSSRDEDLQKLILKISNY